MGVWVDVPDVYDKSHIMRTDCFISHAAFVGNGTLVRQWFRSSIVKAIMASDIGYVWFRVSSTPPSQLVTLGGGTNLLGGPCEYSN
jgi:hypothetical protein